MTGRSDTTEIKRTPAGAIDEYHYFKRGRAIRSEAFHACMKDLWTRMTGKTEAAPSTVTVGLRFEPAS